MKGNPSKFPWRPGQVSIMLITATVAVIILSAVFQTTFLSNVLTSFQIVIFIEFKGLLSL